MAYIDIIDAGRDQFSHSVPGGRWVGDLATVERRPVLSAQSFWEADFDPVVGRQAANLEALIERLPRLVGAA